MVAAPKKADRATPARITASVLTPLSEARARMKMTASRAPVKAQKTTKLGRLMVTAEEAEEWVCPAPRKMMANAAPNAAPLRNAYGKG